jgi:hypothetical protein
MTFAENFVKVSSPLLTIDQLAKLLDRSPEGLRISLRGSKPWVQRINATRLRIGRRVYFRTSEIAVLLSEKEVQ